MEPPRGTPDEEVTRLQRCLNDLLSVLAFPAMWAGRSPQQIVTSFLDGLLSMLRLDVAYVRRLDGEGVHSECLRTASETGLDRAGEVFATLGDDLTTWPRRVAVGPRGTVLSIEPVRLGLHIGAGLVVAGSRRPDFPLQTEQLLLNVATNQLQLALQEARVRLEQKRVVDEARLRQVIDTIPSIAWCNLPEGPNEFLNRGWYDYTGRTPEESQGWGWVEAMHQDDLPALLAKWAEIMSSGKPDQIECRIRRHDGEYRWFLIRAEPFRDDTGRIVRWWGTSTDIDDRKRMEEALRASERKFIQIVNAVPALVWAARPDGTGEFFSESYIAYAGFTLDELQDWGWTQIIHPDDLKTLIGVWESTRDVGGPAETEARLRRFDGVYRWFLFRAKPVFDESGALMMWYGVNTDIDDRKRAEERLRHSEAFLAEGQNLARIGNFAWLAETDEMKWSEQLYRIFEYESDTRVTLELLAARVHPDDIGMLEDMIGKARRAASDLEYSIRLLMSDGTIKHLQLVAHATRDHQGRLEYLGAVQDLTQRRASEEALGKARIDLTNVTRMTSLGVLTAAIAHEVNQPISGIITNANTCVRMLSAESPNINGALETARRTIRDGNRAADVIARLRSLYTRRSSEPEPMDLNDATQEVVSLSLSELQRNGVSLRLEFSDNLPLISGDRIQLQQVIMNLLRNASDAMRTVDDRPRDLLISTEPGDSGNVLLSVRDAGIGFVDGSADRIFEPFHTTKSDGMGIGLSVSRSIIEAHRGRLWATLNEGYGVTFAFSLPILDTMV